MNYTEEADFSCNKQDISQHKKKVKCGCIFLNSCSEMFISKYLRFLRGKIFFLTL